MIVRSALVAGALLLAACPRFHSGKLTDAPADATFVEVDGVHLRYREAGSGPVVVMIHGFGASSDSWLSVMPSVASGHRVIAVDLKGFGWSDRPEGDYSPAAQALLVWHLLDKLGAKDVAIVGHSWGSSVALTMAVTQPERVRRVALYDAYVYDDQVPSFFRWAEKSGLGEVLFGLYYKERFEDRAPLAYKDERWVTQPRLDQIEVELDRPGTVAAALATSRKHQFGPLHTALRTFTKPVLLLWGEDDEVTPLRFGQRLVNELQNAELEVYPLCGHIPMVEAHAQSTRDLVAFLAADPATAPSPAKATPDDTDPKRAEPLDQRHDDGGSDPRRQPGADGDGRPSGGQGGGGGGGGGARAGGGDGAGSSDGSSDHGGGRPSLTPPNVSTQFALPIGADLAALGAELTPRQYAAPRDKFQVVVHGGFRLREQGLFNLDLDRGLDASGQPVYPVPLGGGQKLEAADLRARTDISIYAPGVGVAVKARIDWLDNVPLGGDPDLANGSVATSGGQRPTVVVIKRAWGEALTPFGILAAGRMGAHFGLGITANGGDCDDCDKGDAADRVAFTTPVLGHLLAVAWEVAARGPFTRPRDGGHPVTVDATDSASGVTIAALKVHSPAALARRAAAGSTSVEYGAYVSIRAQENDVPASYLPTATPQTTYTSNDLVARGFSATTSGGWLRISRAGLRIEAELAYARAYIDQPSLIPGTEITIPVTSSQLGFALQSDFAIGPGQLGLDGGYASGDDAPGFGAFPKVGDRAPMPGSFDGAQANLPSDATVDNFRFHPDYRIDQILFREIIGTITDAVYVRPHARLTLMTVGAGRLEAGAALIASWAVEARSTPSGEKSLGIELDPELRYSHRDGFAGAITYGVFLPGPAFDGTTLPAKPAHAVRARLWFVF